MFAIPRSQNALVVAGPGHVAPVQQLALFMDATSPRSLSIGDRVAGAVHGNNSLEPRVGAFAQDSLSIEDLIDRAGPESDVTPNAAWVLVSGGSSATGTRAIQLLKLAGLRSIATCSPSNFALVLGFGAEKAFNYRSPDCAKEIRAYRRNGLA
ncbi:hypothetical protein EYZ11_011981 [Aspergillus tanneri]|uniref:Alcohol dehydrogenase-like C-terminal domain-containing protein n=1 Tax=Aspergillus tanneri TaxID=1220188 RepID=A0A4S3J3J0_9EURO|nr:hypothetical protein EYZ11_011981 [Aspergillus tanneri]